jgi:hypothetical protein
MLRRDCAHSEASDSQRQFSHDSLSILLRSAEQYLTAAYTTMDDRPRGHATIDQTLGLPIASPVSDRWTCSRNSIARTSIWTQLTVVGHLPSQEPRNRPQRTQAAFSSSPHW